MMNCSKCQGLMCHVEEDGLHMRKCQNCGKREFLDLKPGKIEVRVKPDSTLQHAPPKVTISDFSRSVPAPPLCSVPGCKKPKYEGSVQCERHYKKALRNNVKHRARAKQAMNGSAEGTAWKNPVLSALFEQRDLAAAKLSELDRLITSVRGL